MTHCRTQHTILGKKSSPCRRGTQRQCCLHECMAGSSQHSANNQMKLGRIYRTPCSQSVMSGCSLVGEQAQQTRCVKCQWRNKKKCVIMRKQPASLTSMCGACCCEAMHHYTGCVADSQPASHAPTYGMHVVLRACVTAVAAMAASAAVPDPTSSLMPTPQPARLLSAAVMWSTSGMKRNFMRRGSRR